MHLADWELATVIIVALLLVVIVIFSVFRQSSRIKMGVFIERELLDRDKHKPPTDEDTHEWPTRKD